MPASPYPVNAPDDRSMVVYDQFGKATYAVDTGSPANWVAINLGADSPVSGLNPAPSACRGLWVGVAGNIKVDTLGGQVGVVIPNVPVGELSGQFTKVYSTANGTAASSLFWLF